MDQENKDFPFVKMLSNKPDLWKAMVKFYGIDEEKFPKDNLAF
jgi:hypothetical protein